MKCEVSMTFAIDIEGNTEEDCLRKAQLKFSQLLEDKGIAFLNWEMDDVQE